jgi:hypothetical protein
LHYAGGATAAPARARRNFSSLDKALCTHGTEAFVVFLPRRTEKAIALPGLWIN